MTDAIDRAISGATRPAEVGQMQIPLPPDGTGAQRVVQLAMPLPFTAFDVLVVANVLTQVLVNEPKAQQRSRIVVPRT